MISDITQNIRDLCQKMQKKTHRSMLKHKTWIMIKSDNWGGGGGFDPKVIIEWYRGRGGSTQGQKGVIWYLNAL